MVQAMLADMIVSVEAARLLCRRVAQLKEAGVERASYEASMAKLYAADVCMKVAEDAVQIHGGYGLTAEARSGGTSRRRRCSRSARGRASFSGC